MRTLQIGDTWLEEDQGGLSRYYYELLRNLPGVGVSSRGMVVGSDRVALSTNGEVQAFARPGDPLLHRLHACRQMALTELSHLQPDLIVSHFAVYSLPLLDRLRSFPNVVHFHGPWAGESEAEGSMGLASSIKARCERLVYKQADRLIVLSESFRDELIRRYGVDGDRIRIVPGAVDLDRFNNLQARFTARKELGWPTDSPILLTIRRHVRRMGLENLVHAMTSIRQQIPEALLLLGGTGPLTGELHRLVVERGLEANVRLIGRIPDADLAKAYRAADLTVVPTVALEGFGLITLESLASGTPVYVTPVGGLPEIVQPFAPDCVFADISSAGMAEVLVGALEGTRPMPSGESCRAYAERFSWHRIAGQIKDVYAEAAG